MRRGLRGIADFHSQIRAFRVIRALKCLRLFPAAFIFALVAAVFGASVPLVAFAWLPSGRQSRSFLPFWGLSGWLPVVPR